MSDRIAEPFYRPERGSGRADWMQFSKCLSKMLRHTGGKGHHSRRQTFDRITDSAGWARIGDISKTASRLK
eukprot:16433309-Heterocapsa_arctica.AAC.1